MRIGMGVTRFVFLTGNSAIKIARPGFTRIVVQMVKAFLPQYADWKEDRLLKYGARNSPIRAVVNYLRYNVLAGIRANRQEWRLSHDYPGLPLAKVTKRYLGGIIIVMERGEPVHAERSESLRECYCGDDCDLHEPRHVCAFKDGLRFIDYGHEKAPELLGVHI